MLFSSPVFFVFFITYFVFHRYIPSAYRIYLIIVGSTIFYAYWNPLYVWLPYYLIVVAFFGTRWLDGAGDPRSRRLRFGATIGALLAPLLFFKYTDFVYARILGPLLGVDGVVLGLPLPLGVSFIVFTMIAFVVDSHRRVYAERPPFAQALGFALFFPHLIAGPILRPHELLPQLARPRFATPSRIKLGIAIFTVGLVKKLVFADQIAPAVAAVYSAASDLPLRAWDYWLAIYGFSVQIYCDFSGYTDMAIGSAMLLGVRLPVNFRRPYCAVSVADFWRTWHITLSMWLRRYVYFPLGSNRFGLRLQVRNLMITMLLGGLWHGANWTFVIWGGVHGVALVLQHGARRLRGSLHLPDLPAWVGTLATFHFVTFTWILFRAADLSVVGRVAGGPFVASYGDAVGFARAHGLELALLGVFGLLHRFDDIARLRFAVQRLPTPILIPLLLAAWAIAIAVSAGSSAQFIYFDF